MAAPTSQPAAEAIPPDSSEDQKMEDLLNRHLASVQLPGVALSDSIDFIRDITGANVYVDWKAIALGGVTQNTRVKLRATNISVRQAFEKLLKATGSNALEIRVMHGAIVVSTRLNFADRKAQKGPYLAELSDSSKDAAVLERHIASVQLPQVSLSDGIDFMRDITGVPIEVKWKPLAAAGINMNTQITLTIHDAQVSSVLYFILDQAGDGKLAYVTEPTEIMAYDKTLKKSVPMQTELITISTIDDLEAGKAKPATQPN
jgi:hypothetical protein